MRTTAPIISIIIPCYNVPEEYIRRALDSIMAQTFTDYEIIVVDDGSSDEYHEALERCASAYDRVRLITTPNNGVSMARNIGVEHALGEYIAFVDADDYVSKYYLEEAYEAVQRTDANFVIGGTRTFKEFGEVFPDAKIENADYIVYRGEEVRSLFCNLGCLRQTIRFGNAYVGRGPVSRLLKKTIAELVPFYKELIVGEDLVWNLEVLSHCNCVCIVKNQWYWYWHNPNSALHRNNPEMCNEIIKAIDKIAPLMNMEDDKEYLTFLYLIVDSIQTIRSSILQYTNSSNTEQTSQIKKAIYTEYPWIKIMERRFFRICPPKYKVMSLFYRFHLLLLYWDIRERLAQK